MTDEINQLQLTSPPASLERRRHQATLVTAGNRIVSSDGRFHPNLAAKYIRDRGHKEWIKVHELAKVFASPTNEGRKRVRRNVFAVFTALLNDGHFLVYETGDRGRIQAVKLLDPSSAQERQLVIPQLERMKRRREITDEKYERALAVIHLREQLV